MPFTENLDLFLADFGVPVTFAGAPVGTVGIEDFATVDVLDENGRAAVLAGDRTIYLKSTVAALLSVGDTITVNGTPRMVKAPRAQDDGAFTLISLR
jgi:hypothetical protein